MHCITLQVWDADAMSPLSDTLVGATEVDLEDRWFEMTWRIRISSLNHYA